MKNKIKVSILCITYNQCGYIKQALDSFLLQKTNFKFEILIHDDLSTDGTTEMIKEYAQKHPDIIKPVYEKVNQYSKHNFEFIKDMYIAAKGDYIATCEGDDYWIDNNKIQKQADFLDKNLNYSICFSPSKVVYEDNEKVAEIFPEGKDAEQFTIGSLLKTNFIQTSSVMYRKKDSYENMFAGAMPGDWYTHIYHAGFNKIGFIDNVMSVYRRHSGGVWWTAHDKDVVFWVKYGLGLLHTYQEIFEIYKHDKELIGIIYESVSSVYDSILCLPENIQTNEIVQQSLSQYPKLVTGAYLNYKKQFERMDKLARKEQDDILSLHADIKAKNEYIHNLEAQLKSVYDNKSWHLLTKLQRYKNKLRFKK